MNIPASKFSWIPGILAIGLILSVSYVTLNLRAPTSPSLMGYEIQSFFGKVELYSAAKSAWINPDQGYVITPDDKLRTGDDGQVEFKMMDQVSFRLMNNSQLLFPAKSKSHNPDPVWRVQLETGLLYGATSKTKLEKSIEIILPGLDASTHQAMFLAESNPEEKFSSLGLLRGHASTYDKHGGVVGELKSMQVVKTSRTTPKLQIEEVKAKDWKKLHDVYDLIPKTTESEALQLDLSQKAGDLFKYVFDHGTFYTPKVGFSNREFTEEPDTREVYLEAEYDVFPTGSIAGIYLKTRDLDISKFEKLAFEARRDPFEESYPNAFKIELKSGSTIVRDFVAKVFHPEWTRYEFPLNFSKPQDVREITFVFTNQQVGGYKKGFLQLRNFTLNPKVQKPEATAQEALPASAASSDTTSAESKIPTQQAVVL